MDNEQARELLRKYNSGQCTDSEKMLIEKSFFEFNEHDIDISFSKLQNLKEKIKAELPNNKAKKSLLKISITVATAAAVIALGIYLLSPRPENGTVSTLNIAKRIFSKGNVAYIKLSDGKTIQLDQKQRQVEVTAAGLIYGNGTKISGILPTEYQTISTPKGGEYMIVLSDGTKVWLNAATVLQYPISFQERSERRVKLVSGEAYFEVAKDKNHPFIVNTANQELKVLGTRFNINAYHSSIRTTLTEGSVKLNLLGTKASIKLIPGEEASTESGKFKKSEADLELALAWKSGKLKFRNASLENVLDEAERWYGIQIKYEGVIPDTYLTGGISRKSSLATLLKLLKMSGVNFSLKNEGGINILVIKS